MEHGGDINRLDDERIKQEWKLAHQEAYLQQNRQQESDNKDFGPMKTI